MNTKSEYAVEGSITSSLSCCFDIYIRNVYFAHPEVQKGDAELVGKKECKECIYAKHHKQTKWSLLLEVLCV